MRLILVALVAVLCLAFAYAADDAQPDSDRQVIGEIQESEREDSHSNHGASAPREHEAGGWKQGGYR